MPLSALESEPNTIDQLKAQYQRITADLALSNQDPAQPVEAAAFGAPLAERSTALPLPDQPQEPTAADRLKAQYERLAAELALPGFDPERLGETTGSHLELLEPTTALPPELGAYRASQDPKSLAAGQSAALDGWLEAEPAWFDPDQAKADDTAVLGAPLDAPKSEPTAEDKATPDAKPQPELNAPLLSATAGGAAAAAVGPASGKAPQINAPAGLNSATAGGAAAVAVGPARGKAPQINAPAGLATDPAEVDPADTAASLKAVRFPLVKPIEAKSQRPETEPKWHPSPSSPDPPKSRAWHRRLFAHFGFKREGASPALTIVLLIVLLALLAGVGFLVANLIGGNGEVIEAPPDVTPTPGAEGATDWSKGQIFDGGDGFSYRLVSIENGITSLTNNGANLSEHGQFFAVQVQVIWQGEGQGTFLADQQFLGTSAGQVYANEPDSANLLKGTSLGGTPLSSGQSADGYLVFDIPRDEYADRLVLTGQLGYEPVIVPLG